MTKVILATFLMMGGAFTIGFAVAYLIKAISLTLNSLETFSFPEYVHAMKRTRNIRKIRYENINRLFAIFQKQNRNELLDYSFPCHMEEKQFDFRKENELIHYRYPAQVKESNIDYNRDNELLHYRYGKN